MNRPRSSFLALLIAFLLCIQPAFGQQNSSSNIANAELQERAELREKSELRDKAFKLLESLAGQLGSLQSAENRVRIGSTLEPHAFDAALTEEGYAPQPAA